MHLKQEKSIYKGSVRDVIKQRLYEISTAPEYDVDEENSFFVGDLAEIYRQHMKWKELLPRIEPFYAVKCNPNPETVGYLASLGIGFDCASKTELQLVLNLGVDPSRIIYAQPCKQPAFVRYAAQNKVSMMTFDNEDELYKVKELFPDAKLVLRMLVDDSKSGMKLGLKHGAPPNTIPRLLKTAKVLDLNIIGVSFHVGSGCSDESAFYDAVVGARHVFDQAEEMGFNFTLLDVGGGFSKVSTNHGVTFEKTAKVLGAAVDAMFPSSVRVIAEPGRYYVATAYTLCTNVIARRIIYSDQNTGTTPIQKFIDDNSDTQPKIMYYINEGVYGSFLLPMLDIFKYPLQVLKKGGKYCHGHEIKEKMYQSCFWGPTCCPYDCIVKEDYFPLLDIGDWLYVENAGAYAPAGASGFNGFEKAKFYHTSTLDM